MQRFATEIAIMLLISLAVAKELTEIEVLSSRPNRCTYDYAFDMYGAHCAGLRLDKIPSLKGGLEILDFSDNKLQELKADTFAGYSGLKLLYLSENQIYHIEVNALSHLTKLQVLDLSKNVLLNLPNSLLQLPSLKRLNLAHNPLPLLHSSGMIISKPIKAPLEVLDISDCKFKNLPSLGRLPQLSFYNISHNPLDTIEAEYFAAMCNLNQIDLTSAIEKIPVCKLKPTITWLGEKSVHIKLDDSGYAILNSKAFDSCSVKEELPGDLNATYHRCKAEFMQVQYVKASRRTWLKVGCGLAGFLVGFMLLLYIMHRRNVAETRNPKKKPIPSENCNKQASKVLLSDVA